MAKKYYWLKLKNDFFTSRQMKKLRKIAGGDIYTIIYLKLQLLSLQDEGRLYYEGVESNFYEEMALEIDEEPENVQATLIFLQNCGLIEMLTESEYLLTEVPIAIGSETDIAKRVRKSRENKKKALQCNTNETKCNTEIEIEKEIDIEIETDIERESEREKTKNNYQQIADMYNNTCVSFPRLTKLSDTRKKSIKARLNTYTIGDFQRLFELAESSDFLKGGNNRNWMATFDWLIKDSNMAKVLDGNYEQKQTNKTGHNKKQSTTDFYEDMRKWVEEKENGSQDFGF
ncbi:phage replisome organizer N-terminal domain-containing protein [Anaerosacchariphilus polymeriproducens]|uniref:Phage replisome organiser N-terminal domain-containing protein n=1 Tax=Anaerosacchariphilus polymeriproducens TaxID=1812858 RepID=A0A371AZY0_9FIRM|nr:phage replisome organizer N-terminal domain-containing protein [Anaerosacchariphilus polymeriproducens]RDU25040.1 hypothetical protein DWV06_01230 [Anaerosacchariphilus polymeriproducens]